MSERELQWKLKLEGIEESLRSLKELEDRVKSVEAAHVSLTRKTKEQTKETDGLGDKAKEAAAHFGGFNSILAKSGAAIGRINPAIGSLATGVASASGAVGGLSAAFGPLGIALGASVAIFGFVTSAIEATEREMANLARGTIRTAATFDELMSKMRQARAEQDRSQGLAAGTMSAEEHTAESLRLTGMNGEIVTLEARRVALADRQRARTEAMARLDEQGGRRSGDRRTRLMTASLESQHARDAAEAVRIDAQIADLRSRASGQRLFANAAADRERIAALPLDVKLMNGYELTAEERASVLARDASLDAARRGGRGGGGGVGGRAVNDKGDPIGRPAGTLADKDEAIAAYQLHRTEESGRSMDKDAEAINARLAREAELKEQTSWQKEVGDAGVKSALETSEAWNAALTEIGNLYDQTFARAISGQMSFGDALREGTKVWLQQFAIKEGKLALAAIAEGTGLLFVNPPAAGSKFAEAALHGALAAGAGIGAAAIGGGGGASAAQQSGGSSRVLGAGVRDDKRGGGNTYVINVGTFAVGTKAEVGREIRGALAAAERHDGAAV